MLERRSLLVLLPTPIPPWGLRVKARSEANYGEKGRQRQTAQEKGTETETETDRDPGSGGASAIQKSGSLEK